MLIRKLRLEKGWTQEELAEMCDLSVRTIQRIERGQKPGLETIKSLASVFEVDFTDLSHGLGINTQESTMTNQQNIQTDTDKNNIDITSDESKELLYVKDIRGFYSHIIKYVIVMSILLVIDLLTTPGKFWVQWPAMGWGIGLIMHGMSVFEIFNFFSPRWEKKQFDRRMKRKSRRNTNY